MLLPPFTYNYMMFPTGLKKLRKRWTDIFAFNCVSSFIALATIHMFIKPNGKRLKISPKK